MIKKITFALFLLTTWLIASQVNAFGWEPLGENQIKKEEASMNASFNATISSFMPPANDECVNATQLNCGDVLLTETTDDASGNGGDTGCSLGQGVWYRFEGSGQLIAVTVDSDFDAEIAVASSTDCVNFNNIRCEDDGNPEEVREADVSIDTAFGRHLT